jgi:hypothetical protein
MIYKNDNDDYYDKDDDDDDDNDNYNSYEQDMINKAAGYMISKYIYEIKKFKIDLTTTIKPTSIQDYFYNLIKNLVLNDKEFHNYTFDNYKIHFRYNEEKNMFYYINYN